eukprot:GEMP01016096.1.p1 GENE.GEMP01016096.1~~GEMP01016096.1.p1  ORF type:complete len:521 (+),score=110.04 GEMP01016096.1:25-1563(+)
MAFRLLVCVPVRGIVDPELAERWYVKYPCLKTVSPTGDWNECAVAAAAEIPALCFNNHDWRQVDFEWYLIQDAKYWDAYSVMVVAKAEKLCGPFDISPRLRDPFDVVRYEGRYELQGVGYIEDSSTFLQYKVHYESQKTCDSMLSAMLPRLCLYPPLAKKVQQDAVRNIVQQQHWMEDNIMNTGRMCQSVQNLLADRMDAVAFHASLVLELAFIDQTHPSASDLGRAPLQNFTSVLPGDGTSLSDDGYKKMYEDMIEVDRYSSEFDPFVQFVLNYTREARKDSFLDVGSGPCHVASIFYVQYARSVLVEPIPDFQESCAKRLSGTEAEKTTTMFRGRFESYECDPGGYDLVVLAHVLYHVAAEKRVQFLQKAWDCTAPGGTMAVAIVHDDGEQHEFVKSFNPLYATSGDVKRFFSSVECQFTSDIDRFPVTYDAPSMMENFENAYRMLYFSVVEDSLPREQYQNMRAEESAQLEHRIRQYTWSRMEVDYSFSILVEDEFMVATKPPQNHDDL